MRPLGAPPSERRRVRWALAALVGIALLVRGVHFAAIAGSAFPQIQLLIPGADTIAHWEWSAQIAAGDWLGRETYHQFTGWMSDVAPLETWIRWWGGAATFHREPVYPYVLALLRSVLGKESLLAVLGIQLAIGALRPLVLFALARRLFDDRAGLLAAALGAIYGPFVFFEATLLRDWIPSLVDPLLLVMLLRAGESGRASRWLLAGAMSALCVLVRSPVMLFLPLALAWAVSRRGSQRFQPRAGLLLLAGLAVGFLPLAARNLAVGAPVLSISNRATDAIIVSNAADCEPVGMVIPKSFPELMEKSRGNPWTALVESVRTHRGDAWGFLALQGVKLWGLLDTREHADNLDYEYGKSFSPVLRVLPTFAVAGLLGLAGLFLFTGRGSGRTLAAAYVLAAFGAQFAAVVVARYRLGLVAVLLVLGAGYAVPVLDRLREGGLRRAAPALSLVPILLVLHLTLQPPHLRDPAIVTSGRAIEYELAAQVRVSQGRFAEGLEEARRFRERAGPIPRRAETAGYMEGFVRCAWAEALLTAGDPARAREQLAAARTAFEVPGQDPSAWFLLGRIHLALGERAVGRRWLERSIAEEPSGRFSGAARELLRR